MRHICVDSDEDVVDDRVINELRNSWSYRSFGNVREGPLPGFLGLGGEDKVVHRITLYLRDKKEEVSRFQLILLLSSGFSFTCRMIRVWERCCSY